MSNTTTYFVVTGAFGSGKSATVKELLNLDSGLVVFDLDWLHESAGELARTSIYTDASTWPAYHKLWFEILTSIAKNNKTPVLFCPLDTHELDDSLATLSWLLLDCDDVERERRLLKRGWNEAQIQEAVQDAQNLRDQITVRVDTAANNPEEVARKVIEWVQAHS